MLSFIHLLQQRYQQTLQNTQLPERLSSEYTDCLQSLVVAQNSILKEQTADLKLKNIAVLGPTQSGKSTLTNLLLGEPLAGVSPLAGFTVHPQGFVSGELIDAQIFSPFFTQYSQTDRTNLQSTDYQHYSITHCPHDHALQQYAPIVIWDTPDFDSIKATGYRDAVLRTAALADLLILIVSKEKYADQTVWDLLKLFSPLQRPLIVCLNKVQPEDAEPLTRSFLQHFKSQLPTGTAPPVITLPFLPADQLAASPEITAMQTLVKDQIEQLNPATAENVARHFVTKHWESWITPIKNENQTHQDQADQLDHLIDRAIESYTTEFLDHPHYYDTFQHAIVALLNLLEIPLLAKPLTKMRKAITWPARQILDLGSRAFQSKTTASENSDNAEQTLLLQLTDHILTQLAEYSLSMSEELQTSQPWLRDQRQALINSRARLLGELNDQIEKYQQDFQPEIEQAAQQLYQQLQSQPTTLNSLRATRASADAAAVILAVKTGGLSPHDLVLAPAMLSVSSLLAESSLGGYMNTIKQKLKAQQLEKVTYLLKAEFRSNLLAVTYKPADQTCFNISPEQIQQAENELFNR